MNKLLSLVACPQCGASWNERWISSPSENDISCPQCTTFYPAIGSNSFRVLGDDASKQKDQLKAFWGDLYRQLYSSSESLGSKELNSELSLLEEYFRKQHHLAVNEMNLSDLAGKVVLEIGSGSGAHSALFRSYGARVISVDLTPERVLSTERMLSATESTTADYLCLHADGESLPIQTDSIDIVYSNGVLHHSPNTEKCISEVYRVLKPGGHAAIMLYCRSSALFYSLLMWQGLLNGARFKRREEEWLGMVTEGKPVNQHAYNPITRVYSRNEILSLLKDFELISLRKGSFLYGQLLPRGGSLLDQVLNFFSGTRKHRGGLLVYGEDAILQSNIERWIGTHLGFAWNALIKK